jgi:hypothetical protein
LNLDFIESTNLNAKSTAFKGFEPNFWFKGLWTSPTSKKKVDGQHMYFMLYKQECHTKVDAEKRKGKEW